MITYNKNKTVPEEKLRELYQSVGWVAYLDKVDSLHRMIENSQEVVTAWEGEELIGLARIVGDGYYVGLIQDLLVKPAYQQKGVGKQLFQQIRELGARYHQLFLITDGSVENQYVVDWYQQQGMVPFEKVQTVGYYRV